MRLLKDRTRSRLMAGWIAATTAMSMIGSTAACYHGSMWWILGVPASATLGALAIHSIWLDRES